MFALSLEKKRVGQKMSPFRKVLSTCLGWNKCVVLKAALQPGAQTWQSPIPLCSFCEVSSGS